jgi:ribosomal protein S18 acetylase RimI-like enzyme
MRRIAQDEGRELRSIRLRLLADVPWRAVHLVLEKTYAPSYWRERARKGAAHSALAIFVALDGAGWVGIAEGVVREDPSTAEVEGVWVDASWRRQGVGLGLVEAVAAWARAAGLARLGLWVREENASAIGLYARAGFVQTREPVQRPVSSDRQIRMVYDL